MARRAEGYIFIPQEAASFDELQAGKYFSFGLNRSIIDIVEICG